MMVVVHSVETHQLQAIQVKLMKVCHKATHVHKLDQSHALLV